jgi:hypothetical protein
MTGSGNQACRDYRHVVPWLMPAVILRPISSTPAIRCGPHHSRPARTRTWRPRVLRRLAGSNACPAPHPSVTRVRNPAPQLPSASATAALNPGFRPPHSNRSSNQIGLCQRHPTDPHHRSVPAKAEPSVRLAAASSGTSSSVQPISFPQTLAQIARTRTHRRQQSTLSGLRFRVPRLS